MAIFYEKIKRAGELVHRNPDNIVTHRERGDVESSETQGSDATTGVRGTDGIGDHRNVIGTEGCGVELPKRIFKEPRE
jgi:hypothetical protein